MGETTTDREGLVKALRAYGGSECLMHRPPARPCRDRQKGSPERWCGPCVYLAAADLLDSHDQPEPDGWITEAMLARLRERGWTEGRIWQEPRHPGYVPFVIQPTKD